MPSPAPTAASVAAAHALNDACARRDRRGAERACAAFYAAVQPEAVPNLSEIKLLVRRFAATVHDWRIE